MMDGDAKSSAGEREPRFAVGWQKLTKQEFVEALTLAVLDKVRTHQLQQSEHNGSKSMDNTEF